MNNNTEHNNDSAEEQSSELADLSADHGEDVVGGSGIFVDIDTLEPIDLESPTRTGTPTSPTRTTYTSRTFSLIRNINWGSTPDRTL